MNLSAIVQLIIAIPKLIELFMSLWRMIKESESKKAREDQQKAIDDLKKAQTEQEIKDANKRITSNLP